ncbi:MAG TPA: hydrogenase iron-sulfur subunit, partial [Thermoleophilia bacterium]
VLLPCTGRVSPLHLLSALAEGADGVMVAGCLLGQCHYREGNFNAVDRVAFVQRLLKSVGVEPERCQMFTMSAGEPPKFVAAVREMDRAVGVLPPLERSPQATVHAGAGPVVGAGEAA